MPSGDSGCRLQLLGMGQLANPSMSSGRGDSYTVILLRRRKGLNSVFSTDKSALDVVKAGRQIED